MRFFAHIILILCTAASLAAQGSQNPFELAFRLPEEAAIVEQPEPATAVNPFEVLADRPQPAAEEQETKVQLVPVVIQEKPRQETLPISFWFTLFTGLFLFLTLMVVIFRRHFQHLYRAFSNENYLKLLHREKAGQSPIPFILLHLFGLANIGILLFLASHNLLGWSFPGLPRQIIAGVVVTLVAFVFIKQLALTIAGAIFPIQKKTALYNFTISTFNTVAGWFLFPLNILAVFVPEPASPIFLYAGLGLLALFYLYRSIRGLLLATDALAFQKFHFFVYLCTVELGPLAVLVKFIADLSGY